MKKLSEMVELVENNNNCVVLKVKDDCELDLICTGCFDGDETMFRLTKGKTVTCTVFRNNGNSFSWHWGYAGFTLVSDKADKMGRMIQNCIEHDFGIKCQF